MPNSSEMSEPRTKGEKTRDNIIRTAGAMFSEKGYYTTSIDEIAKKLHIANGTLYRYFSSKEDLLSAILSSSESEIMERIDTIHFPGQTLLELLCNIPVILYAFITDYYDVYDLFYSVWQNRDFPFLNNNYSLHGRIIAKISSVLEQYSDSFKENVDLDSLSVMIFFIFESARHYIRINSVKNIDFRDYISKPVAILYYGCGKE